MRCSCTCTCPCLRPGLGIHHRSSKVRPEGFVRARVKGTSMNSLSTHNTMANETMSSVMCFNLYRCATPVDESLRLAVHKSRCSVALLALTLTPLLTLSNSSANMPPLKQAYLSDSQCIATASLSNTHKDAVTLPDHASGNRTKT